MTEPLGEAAPAVVADYLSPELLLDLTQALVHYERFLDQLEPLAALRFGEVDEAVRQGAKETLLAGALAIESHRGLLAAAGRRLVGWLDTVTVDGELVALDELGTWSVGDNPKLTYDNARTASAFAARLADEIPLMDPETGEAIPWAVTVGKIVSETAEALGGLAPSRGWNKTPLRKRGLNPDAYVVARERTDRKLQERR